MRRPSITDMMVLVLWAALLLGLMKALLDARDIVLAGLVLVVGVPLAHVFYFHTLPARLLPRLARRWPGIRGRLLEVIVATPSLLGSRVKTLARYQLMSHYQAKGLYEDAAFLARVLLARRIRARSYEAHVRQHLADCLEALGRQTEAEAERARARKAVTVAVQQSLRG
jgi:hypothetical protein